MTETEWLTPLEPLKLASFIAFATSNRKLRLFSCATVRVLWSSVLRQPIPEVVEISEQYADGAVSKRELKNSRIGMRDARAALGNPFEVLDAKAKRIWAAMSVTETVATEFDHRTTYTQLLTQNSNGLKLLTQHWNDIRDRLRDIFGNPFRPISFDPAWLTPTAVALANGIYAERAFDRMPILADALEESGCDNADVLLHCRGGGPHVKGCWVVDAVLGKE